MSVAEQQAARSLLASIQLMGEHRTNPVLLLLGNPPRMRQAVKYPAGRLQFGSHGLQAYYHTHAEPWRRPGEHGHFHLFVQADADQWSHLAALSIDREGQPQAWFTVNNWVTGGVWLDGRVLLQRLDTALDASREGQTLSLLERWLTDMLALYRRHLPGLLQDRDSTLQDSGTVLQDILEDRQQYELSMQGISLEHELCEQFGVGSTRG